MIDFSILRLKPYQKIDILFHVFDRLYIVLFLEWNNSDDDDDELFLVCLSSKRRGALCPTKTGTFFLIPKAVIKKREECRTTTKSQWPASGRCYAVKPSFVFTIMLCFMRYYFLIMQLPVFLLSETLLTSKPTPYVLISFLAWRNDLFFREIFYFETRTQMLLPPLLSPCQ